MTEVLLSCLKAVYDVLISSNARMQLDVHHPVRVAIMQGHEPVTLAHVCLVVSQGLFFWPTNICSILENDLRGHVSFPFVGFNCQALRGANLGALILHCHLTIPR